MTNPKFTTLYCCICGTEVGSKPGEGAVVGLRCQDPACQVQCPASPLLARDAVMSALLRDKVPAPIVAASFGTSRQRVYQIADAYSVGG